MKKIFLISLFLFVFQSCAPIVGTVGMFSLGAASKEKGFGTTLNDTVIKTKISNLIFMEIEKFLLQESLLKFMKMLF